MWQIAKPSDRFISSMRWKCDNCENVSDWCGIKRADGVPWDESDLKPAVDRLVDELAPKMFIELGWKRDGDIMYCPKCANQ